MYRRYAPSNVYRSRARNNWRSYKSMRGSRVPRYNSRYRSRLPDKAIANLDRRRQALAKRRFGAGGSLTQQASAYSLPYMVIGRNQGYVDTYVDQATQAATDGALQVTNPHAIWVNSGISQNVGAQAKRVGERLQLHRLEWAFVPSEGGDITEGGQWFVVDVFFDETCTGSHPAATLFFDAANSEYHPLLAHVSTNYSRRFQHLQAAKTEQHGKQDTYHKQHGAINGVVDLGGRIMEFKETAATGNIADVLAGNVYVTIRTSRPGVAWTADDYFFSARIFYSSF